MSEDPAKFAPDRRGLGLLKTLGLEVKHVFDVGACKGEWTRHIRMDLPDATFDMFEPLADHAQELGALLQQNLDSPNVRLHKFALGAENKKTRMFLYPDNLPGSTALELEVAPQHARQVEVEMRTLDDVVQRLELPSPDLVKIDAQGCELNILQGARKTLTQTNVLLLECWLRRGYGKPTPLLVEIVEWLKELDFYLWDLAGQWRDSTGTLVSQDCFFVNARCPISPLREELRP